jgi:hypothetical protein
MWGHFDREMSYRSPIFMIFHLLHRQLHSYNGITV